MWTPLCKHSSNLELTFIHTISSIARKYLITLQASQFSSYRSLSSGNNICIIVSIPGHTVPLLTFSFYRIIRPCSFPLPYVYCYCSAVFFSNVLLHFLSNYLYLCFSLSHPSFSSAPNSYRCLRHTGDLPAYLFGLVN